MEERPAFLDLPAPAGYVAGLGRGAVGFTTRADVGSANVNKLELSQANNNSYASDDERFDDAPEDDEAGLFANRNDSKDDDEAENIYKQVEDSMQRKNPNKKSLVKTSSDDNENENSKVKDQFADLKRGLAQVSVDEWADLPEVGDITKKNKRQRLEQKAESRFYAVPDSVIAAAASRAEVSGQVVSTENEEPDFRSIASAKDKMLSMALDQSSSSNSSTSVDPSGYLTMLSAASQSGTNGLNAGEVGDVNRARLLLQSLVRANPLDPGGWIGLARVEELSQNSAKALKSINEGCEHCPTNEDVWLESIRLNGKYASKAPASKAPAKTAAKKATTALPHSVSLWMSRIHLETDILQKKRIVQLALGHNPHAAELWKVAVNLETDQNDARLLLETAVEQVPQDEELWLTLARLEAPRNPAIARKVLNKARKTLKTSRAVWVAAAKLEEKDGASPDSVRAIIEKGIPELIQLGLPSDLASWIDICYECEAEGSALTCGAIIQVAARHEMNESKKLDGGRGDGNNNTEDNVSVYSAHIAQSNILSRWTQLAQLAEKSDHYVTAYNAYMLICEEVPSDVDAWRRVVKLEKRLGTRKSLYATLRRAIEECPSRTSFWSLLVLEKEKIGDLEGAKSTVLQALQSVPDASELWLAGVDIEIRMENYEEAAKLLASARSATSEGKTMDNPENVWVRSIIFERQLAHMTSQQTSDEKHLKKAIEIYTGALELADTALAAYPSCAELYIHKGQIQQHSLHNHAEARATYEQGTSKCPHSSELWRILAELEQENGGALRARAVLDRATIVNPQNEHLWTAKILLEMSASNLPQASKVAAHALQQCPLSGLLWSLQVRLTPFLRRKTQIMEGIRRLESSNSDERDPSQPSISYILTSAARHFWMDGKFARAHSWLDKAIKGEPNNGDTWVWLYKYAKEKGSSSDVDAVVEQFEAANPTAGFLWSRKLQFAELASIKPVDLLPQVAQEISLDD